jgi:tetratricopeptide (TPR) repeat protein
MGQLRLGVLLGVWLWAAAGTLAQPISGDANTCFAAQFELPASWPDKPGKRKACAAVAAQAATAPRDKASAQAIIGLIDRLTEGPAAGKAECDAAVLLDPGNAIGLFCKGTIALDLGAWAEGMAALEMATRQKPDWALPYNNRGTGYADYGVYDKAIADYDQALKRKPDWAQAYNNRANAYAWQGLFDRAIQDYDKAIGLKPDLSAAYNGRGNAYLGKQNYDRAIQDFDKALSLAPNDADVLNNLGLAQMGKGDYARAIQTLDKAVALKPDDARPLGNRGVAHAKLEKYDLAIADLKRALALNKNLAWAAQALSEAEAAKSALAARTRAAQTPPPAPAPGAANRVALIIGNAKYTNGVAPLKNPERDAAAVAKALSAKGYKIFGYPKTNLTRDEMFAAVKAFEAAALTAEVSFVWYAGHGHEFPLADNQKGNFLVPVDIAKDDDILQKGFPLTRLMTAASTARKLRVVVIDACRDSGLLTGTRGGGSSRGFAVEGRSDMLIVYSTRAGQVAADGDGANSPFAAAFLDLFAKNPTADVRLLFSGVTGKTQELTRQAQSPEQVNRLTTLDALALAQ